ncbi:30S ribosomal protein S9 [Candidatus Berkelbacteria bacterium]|nr:30S ribosomal protein S9 [Candidatus Berkelbacteria bacterium]
MAAKTTDQPAKKTTQRRYLYGTGRRKTAIARVRLYEKGNGQITINDRVEPADMIIIAPLELVGELGKWDLSVKVLGGGKQSQKEAIRHGIARALLEANADWRQSLKKAGYLRRDPREKERKKPGLKRARRAPQWAKR